MKLASCSVAQTAWSHNQDGNRKPRPVGRGFLFSLLFCDAANLDHRVGDLRNCGVSLCRPRIFAAEQREHDHKDREPESLENPLHLSLLFGFGLGGHFVQHT